MNDGKGTKHASPWARVAIMGVGLLVAGILAYRTTGRVVPRDPKSSLIFQNALLLIVFGSALLEHKFTKPADSLVNAIMGLVTLVPVYGIGPQSLWWLCVGYCTTVSVASLVCVVVSERPDEPGLRGQIASLTYPVAVTLGKARVLFSVVFLFGVLSFYGSGSRPALELVLFWGAFVVLWPLRLPEALSKLTFGRRSTTPVGRVVRTDWPNLIRVHLFNSETWNLKRMKVYQRVNGTQCVVVPLHVEIRGSEALGTGICAERDGLMVPGLSPGLLYEASTEPVTDSELSESLGGRSASRVIGFVIEDSTIGRLRIETLRDDSVSEGTLVWSRVGGHPVYYQVTEGTTREETLEENRHGFLVATASQLGTLDPVAGFMKQPWLPSMNAPVFAESESFGGGASALQVGDFGFGHIPRTNIQIGGPFREFFDYHTAILGVTGSGKTEVAFDLIRHAVNGGIKVVCIDLTGRYEKRLADMSPVNLSLSGDLSAELGEKLFDAETGTYGAGTEKKALRAFGSRLRADVERNVARFLTSTGVEDRVGIITLNEISNTKASLYVTELYLTCLLNCAKAKGGECPPTLIVVEEAHTVMPEPASMGLGDHDSRGLVSKISQIALQGRKYRDGLLVIAQRTATVSKTVLTQCNTVVSLSCFDETSVGFLSNVFGAEYARLLPNLPTRHAVVFGKAVRSQRPVIVEIPFDNAKAVAEKAVQGSSPNTIALASSANDEPVADAE